MVSNDTYIVCLEGQGLGPEIRVRLQEENSFPESGNLKKIQKKIREFLLNRNLAEIYRRSIKRSRGKGVQIPTSFKKI